MFVVEGALRLVCMVYWAPKNDWGFSLLQRHSSGLSGKMSSLSVTTVNKLKQEEEELTAVSDNHSYNNSLSECLKPDAIC